MSDSPSKMNRRRKLRSRAGEDFPAARHLAFLAGIALVRFTEAHYQLQGNGGEGWVINLYPSTGAVTYERARMPENRINLRDGWKLIDAVRAVAK